MYVYLVKNMKQNAFFCLLSLKVTEVVVKNLVSFDKEDDVYYSYNALKISAVRNHPAITKLGGNKYE
jgi:hypothetical protein